MSKSNPWIIDNTNCDLKYHCNNLAVKYSLGNLVESNKIIGLN